MCIAHQWCFSRTRIDAAVNAIISGERCIWESVKKFKVGDEEVDRALMERGEIQLVNKARMRRYSNKDESWLTLLVISVIYTVVSFNFCLFVSL